MNDNEFRALLKAKGYGDHMSEMGRDRLLARWMEVVLLVERGYPFGLDDYRNDLDVREAISATGLDRDAAEADSRFRDLLTATDKRVWRSDIENDFWNLGYPKNASGTLLSDLKESKLI